MNTLSKWGLGAGLSFGLGLALTLSAAFTMAAAQELDSIAAIVNDDIVLQTDVNTRLGKIKQQLTGLPAGRQGNRLWFVANY